MIFMSQKKLVPNRYLQLVEEIFVSRYKKGQTEVPFEREDLESAAIKLKIKLPKNLGDVIYALRYRIGLPSAVARTQPKDMEWIIEGMGRSKYRFKLARVNRILPNRNLLEIKIPDATPEIIASYSLSDEQALLAKVRYNRLLDIFLGIASYSLQNHLRTSVKELGQVEIDEIYVGVDRHGCQYVIPVQAKGGKDQLSVVQTRQDLLCCGEKFPALVCRAVSAQFMADDLIAVFELVLDHDQIKIVDERHYRLVPYAQISREDLQSYELRRKT